MRFAFLVLSVGFLLLGAVMGSGAAGDGKKNIKPTQRWSGVIDDETKKAAAPKSGMLSSQDAFEKLWNAWGLKEKAPKLDFKKQIVFVQFASGPNRPSTSYSLVQGELKALSIQTLIGGPGFGYGIDVLDRTGIKTYQGKPID